ncbi:MAG: FtsX-like permease family protein [Coriobacteriia bacterium]|nr:FtsX-like permease family protein [Coriobacteriia bacterium]
MSALLKKSWKDLTRRKARTIFTVLTVALGVMGIGMFAIMPLADRSVEAELAAENMHNIGVQVTNVSLTGEQLGQLENLDNVDAVSPKAMLPVTIHMGDRRENAVLVGVPDYDDQAVDVIRITSGEAPSYMEVLTDQGNAANAVISVSGNDEVVLEDLTGRTHNLQVTGIGKNFIYGGATRGGTAVFYTDLGTVQRISGRAGFTQLAFTLEDTDPVAMDETVEVIRDYLVANTSVVAFDNLADVREEGYWEGREIFSQFMSFFAILSFLILFVSLFLISNTMNTMVSEQTREIAMMKAIGATRGKVFRSFLTTSAILGFLGSGIGAVLGAGVAYWVGSTFAREGFGFSPSFDVHWPTVGISVLVGVGVVVAASLPALFRTLRVSVVEGLESHGISADYGQSFLDRSLMGIRGLPRVVQMGVRNALRRKGRSASTALQVAFAVGVIIAMLNLGDGIIDVTIRAYDLRTWDMWTSVEENPDNPITADKAALIEGIEGVDFAEPTIFTFAEVNDRTVPVYGYVQDTRSLNNEGTLVQNGQGRWWTPEEAEAAERVAVVGDALSTFEDIELGEEIELMTATGAHKFEVIGIDTAFGDNGQFVQIPLETVQDVLQKGNAVNSFYLHTDTKDHAEIDAASLRVAEEMESLGYRTDTEVNYVAAEQNVAQNETIAGMFLMVSFIVVLIVLVGLMSTLVMNILDRTTEIGMLRCIGAQSKDVRRVFSSEGLFLAFLGWIVGLPLGYAVFQVIVTALANAMKLTLPDRYDPIYIGWSLVFALLGTVIVIFFPLRRAAKMRPGDAIRYE